jgi:hypothetical protein
MISSAYSITDTRSKVVSAEPLVRNVYMNVVGNTKVYIGGSDVTSSNGVHIEKHTVPCEIVVPYGEELYAVCASGLTETLVVLRPND